MNTTFAAMVEVDQMLLAGVALSAGALVVVALILVWRSRRAVSRRLVSASLRLEQRPPSSESRALDRNLVRLERAADSAMMRLGDAEISADRFSVALEAIPQGVVICDEHAVVVFRNDAAEAFTSARHGEALVTAAISEILDEALGGRRGRRTLDLFGPPRRTLVITAIPLDDDRRTIGGLAIIEDVSERRRLEAVRRDFVANISHELKTPVGALGLLAETLVAEDDPSVIRRMAERMCDEAFRVGRTIDDLLELSRIEAEEAPQREPVPVHLAVAEAVERIRPAAEQQGIEIHVIEAPRRLAVIGDRRQLVSALYNLLDNAVKYSDAGSRVNVTAALDNGNVNVAVKDPGIGIPARDIERIFERFYRVDRARSRETGGTGLGLAIVRHVAANHGGEVKVASHEGEGSTFTLVLPAAPGSLGAIGSPPQTRAG